jgi:hypothetical protein
MPVRMPGCRRLTTRNSPARCRPDPFACHRVLFACYPESFASPESFACHLERSEGSPFVAQDKLREGSHGESILYERTVRDASLRSRQASNKKIPKAIEKTLRIFAGRVLPAPSPPPSHEERLAWTRAGLLARGSFYSSRLPGEDIFFNQWLPVSFVPTYSGGSAGGFHPFPFARVTANFGDTLGPAPPQSQADPDRSIALIQTRKPTRIPACRQRHRR